MSLHPLSNLHALVLSHNLIGNEDHGGQETRFEGFRNQLVNALKGKNKLRSLSLDHNQIKHISR
jgi:Leucine-rich repeat (LRR) protein